MLIRDDFQPVSQFLERNENSQKGIITFESHEGVAHWFGFLDDPCAGRGAGDARMGQFFRTSPFLRCCQIVIFLRSNSGNYLSSNIHLTLF